MKRLYIGGTFDLFHPGHVLLLKKAKEWGEGDNHVIVSVNTDSFCERYKRLPVMSLAQRMLMVESCKYVDEVVVNEGDEDSKPAIKATNPDYIVHGDDWTGDGRFCHLNVFRFL